MMDWIVSWPTWGMTRVFGIAAYMSIFIGLSLGMIYRYPMVKGKQKAHLYRWHTWLTNGGSLLALAHIVVLLIDTYSPYSWREVLVPFAASRHPVLSGLGTIAAYGLLAILITSDYRHKMQKQLWLAIHLTAYPVFLLCAAHGFWMGTDSGKPALQLMYGGSLLITLALFAIRSLLHKKSGNPNGLPTRRAASW